jgi:TonB family protein
MCVQLAADSSTTPKTHIMKHCILLTSALTIFAFTINAQEMASVSNSDLLESSTATYAPPLKVNAHFPGGNEALAEYFDEHLDYNEELRSHAVEGVVIVEFVVQKDGQLANFKVIETPHEKLSELALTALKGMSDWIPAKIHNVDVASRVMLPVHFGLR